MTYSGFTRYFGHLKRLGWVEETGGIEPLTIQEYYPPAPSRVYYRISSLGITASISEIADPLMTLHNYTREQRSAKPRVYVKHHRKPLHPLECQTFSPLAVRYGNSFHSRKTTASFHIQMMMRMQLLPLL